MTTASPRKLLVVDCAALGWELVQKYPPPPGLVFKSIGTVFPAVTCVAQASFKTATQPSAHGLIGNGQFFRDLKKVLFWEQASSLVAGERIWRKLRDRSRRVGMMFWQQSLGEDVDLILSPRPVHKHEGGMIQDCYSQPENLYEDISARTGGGFNLMHYWGPLASRKSSEWIAAATKAVMNAPELAPDLLFTYLPHLDYDLQRFGPNHAKAKRALDVLYSLLLDLKSTADANGYDWLVFGDYAIGECTQPVVFPNRALRESGLFRVRKLKGMAYPDFFASGAFAMVDHEVAHVYCRDESAIRAARATLEKVSGIAEILDRAAQSSRGIAHANAGELVLIAKPGTWFAYPWFTEKKEAPDFATHVDIHNKPGYDPCELFFGWPPPSVSMNTAKIKGSHGRPGEPVAWTSSLHFDFAPQSILDLAAVVRDWCARA
jgi:predicted AlkP superfamily pyrophosphatase or phosphodiesterase